MRPLSDGKALLLVGVAGFVAAMLFSLGVTLGLLGSAALVVADWTAAFWLWSGQTYLPFTGGLALDQQFVWLPIVTPTLAVFFSAIGGVRELVVVERRKEEALGAEHEDSKTKLFVSYRRDDSEYAADRITERLSAHFGTSEIVYDIDTIPYGEDYRSYIADQISECGVLLAIIGRSWLDMRVKDGPRKGERRIDEPDDLVRIEIEAAHEAQMRVIPVVVGRADLPAKKDLPESIQWLVDRNAAEVSSGHDFHTHMDRLVREIEGAVGRPQKKWSLLKRRGATKDGPRGPA